MSDMAKHARLSAAWALVKENPVLPVLAGIGFAVSFQTIAGEARAQHMPGWPVLYPLLIDAGILGFIIEARKAIDDGRSDLVPRLLAWVLSGLTLYVNAHGSPARDWLGIALHSAAPALWIAFLELTRWRKLRKRRAERGDTVPMARWLIAPARTAGMRKRMVLHNVTSYAEASAREEARLLGMDLAAYVFGRRWRRAAPALLRHHLTAGTLPAEVAQAAADGSRGLAEAVALWIHGSHEAGVTAAKRARQAEAAQAPSPADRPPAPRARQRSRQHSRQRPAAGGRAAVRQVLADRPHLTNQQAADEAGVSLATAKRARRDLREDRHGLHLAAR